MSKKFLLLLTLSFLCKSIYSETIIIKPERKYKTSVAMIVDSVTFYKTKNELILYKKSIENDKLSAYILYDNWKNPDHVKNEIKKLYNLKPQLEGVILIGDIPIPMIRGAQHLTSAFKLDEHNYPWYKSSVPSDRFYEDFDLNFEYLGQDSVYFLYHYYQLTGYSPQKIQKEIYSARIKSTPDDSLKYERLKEYLRKVAKIKTKQNKLDNVIVYTGHGYNSESLISFTDENFILQESFPDAFKVEGRLKKYFYQISKQIKKIILEELENPQVDLTIFHAHGEPKAQLISGTLPAKSIDDNIENIKFYLRSKLRAAIKDEKSIEATKEYFKKSFDITDNWFEGAFDEKIKAQDSITISDMEININDIKNIYPKSELIIFDECFNGSFHLQEYISGAYIFNDGETVTAIANTVNVLQDLFINELIGLLSRNWRVGEWHLLNPYLESHIIGDPTHRFYSNDSEIDFITFINNNDLGFWRKKIKHRDPIIRTLSCLKLYMLRAKDFSNDLLKIYENDPSPNVRLMALKILASIQDKNLDKLLIKSINDPNELIRRFSVLLMGYMGKDNFLPIIVNAAFNDESDRVRYNAKNVLELNNRINQIEIIKASIDSILNIKSKYNYNKNLFYVRIPDQKRQKEIFEAVLSSEIPLKKKINELKTFRKYIYSSAIEDLINLSTDTNQLPEIRIIAIECLGWFYFNNEKEKITATLEIQFKNEQNDRIKDEILKTLKRLKEGPNCSLTP